MTNDKVQANPTDVRRLSTALNKYRADVRDASRQVQGALNSADWHDQRKDQFEQRYRDLQSQIDRFLQNEVDQMVKSLNDFARRLEDISRMKM